jgi:16S rRNA (adenine1518-N6/adenine1519-N6)-dimethyltransferase
MKYISTPSRTKEILETYGLHAKKGYGQNFLVDPVIVEKCAEASHCEGAVIEIGPGIGSLTEQLALHSRHVTAYEVDEALRPVLANTLSPYDNVEIIFQDFLKTDLKEKVSSLKEQYGSVAVCANLPYYITTPVLFKLFEEAEIPYITVMVQKEVGDRFAAAPDTPDYSTLSVEGQYLYDIHKLFNVPARSFNPSPAVDSVIIQFSRKEANETQEEINAYFTFLKACFKQRRKTIYNNLKVYTDGDSAKVSTALEQTGIQPSVRAQSLAQEDLRRLYEALR